VVIILGRSKGTARLEQAHICDKRKLHTKYWSESLNERYHCTNKYKSVDNIKPDFEESDEPSVEIKGEEGNLFTLASQFLMDSTPYCYLFMMFCKRRV
jgi:hypothetical protein